MSARIVLPAQYLNPGGAVVSVTATPGPPGLGRVFRMHCNGCDLSESQSTADVSRNYRRTRRRAPLNPVELAHWEGVAFNVVSTAANQHSQQCRRIPPE